MREIGINKGKLLQVTQLKPYLIQRIIGLIIWFVVLTVFTGTSIFFILGEIYPFVLTLIILVGLFIFFIATPFAMIRRVKIYERGIVPASLPYKKLFQKNEYFLPYNRLVDIFSVYNQLIFELDNGEKSEITISDVGEDTFEKLLEIKNKFYWYTSYNRKCNEILLDGKNPWKKYPKKTK